MSQTTLPVGVERVLYAAAVDPDFREALLDDREDALQRGGYQLRPSELAMLQGIADAQLLAAINAVDTSPENVQRRSFLKAAAATAAGVVVVEATSACTGSRPDEPDKKDGGNKDGGTQDGPPPVTGIRPG